MASSASLSRYLLWVIAGLALHVLIAVITPVSGDEAYYWDCARNFDWAYFDQPGAIIWLVKPTTALLGNTNLGLRLPAVLMMALLAFALWGLAGELVGKKGQASAATRAWLLVHAMPIVLIAGGYLSTDIGLVAFYALAAWAALAIARGSAKGWWAFGLVCGIGFSVKFPIVFAGFAVLVALVFSRPARKRLASPTPWLALLASAACTAPVWIWAAQHDFENIKFQFERSGGGGEIGLKYVGEFLGANLGLGTPFLVLAGVIACFRFWRKATPAQRAQRMTMLAAVAAPFLFFGLIALRTRVGAHWAAPGLVLMMLVLAIESGRWFKASWISGAVFGVGITALAVFIAIFPEQLVAAEWSYEGRPNRINTKKLSQLIGDAEILERLRSERREGELIVSDSYSMTHRLAFLSDGEFDTRLANVSGGAHGLASLYWYEPSELAGRDALVISRKDDIGSKLEEIFVSVVELEPIRIERGGEVVRELKLVRASGLLSPVPAFTRLEGEGSDGVPQP